MGSSSWRNPGTLCLRIKSVYEFAQSPLNFREFVVAGGLYPVPLKNPVIPVSDGAGEVD